MNLIVLKRLLIFSLLLAVCLPVWSLDPTLKFFHIGYQAGLSNNCVNCVVKSSRGFLWVGTSLGLDRYDGFTIRNYYSRPGDPLSLPDNVIEEITEVADGKLWIRTGSGYCLYSPLTETFDNDIEGWMRNHGMTGGVRRVCSDAKRNLWIVNSRNQIYYYDVPADKATKVVDAAAGGNHVSNICAKGKRLAVSYENGWIAVYGLPGRQRLLSCDFMKKYANGKNDNYKIFIDSQGNLWVSSSEKFAVGYRGGSSWKSISGYVVRDVAEDQSGHILLATDHDGLVEIDRQGHQTMQWLHDDNDRMSLPDNTLQCVYVDDLGITWVGTYRLGLAFCFNGQRRLGLLPLGDVCSMTQDHSGLLWMGTNDKGIECSRPAFRRRTKRKAAIVVPTTTSKSLSTSICSNSTSTVCSSLALRRRTTRWNRGSHKRR